MACLITIPELAGLSKSFDVVRVDFSHESIVTEHPVEFGAEVTDHVQVRPDRFVVEIIVTDSPLLTVTAVPIPFSVDLARQFFEQCQGKLLTVTLDGEGIWNTVVLERWSHSRTAVGGRRFELSFKPIRIASSLSVTIPPRQGIPAGAVSAVNAGQQAARSALLAQNAAAVASANAQPTSTLSVIAGIFGR